MSNDNVDASVLKEQDNGTPEQFNEAVSAAGRQAWGAVATATKKDPKKAQVFSQTGKIIVSQITAKK